MTRRKNLTPGQRKEIAELRGKGWSFERLAEKFNCSPGAIDWSCLMEGVSSPGWDRRKPSQPVKAYKRNGHVVKPYTKSEDRLIESMRAAGKTLTEITTATGRRHNSITGRLATLARRRLQAETLQELQAERKARAA